SERRLSRSPPRRGCTLGAGSSFPPPPSLVQYPFAPRRESMADPAGPRTILALSSYFKGNRFLQACKQAGWRVLLLTLESRRHEAWDRGTLDDIYFMPAF